MRIASAVFCFALAGFVGLHPTPAVAAEGTVRAVPMHRLFHKGSNASCYVTRDEEIHTLLTKGWKEAGIAGYISPWPFPGGVFFHRLWHPLNGDYYYTADPKSVSDYIYNRGYLAQKGVGYVLPPGTERAGTVPFHMGYDAYSNRHIYVADKITWNPNFQYVMEACRVWPDAAVVSEIRVTSPKAGQVLSVGTSHTITWTTTTTAGGVRLELSIDGGASWKPLTPKPVPNTGSLAWTVPGSVTAQAQIKAAWVDQVVSTNMSWATSVTQGEFSIASGGNPPPPPPPPGPKPPLVGKLPPFLGNPPPLPGNPPTNALTLTATPSLGPKVFLSWTAGVPAGVTGYTIERKPKGGIFSVLRIVGKNVTQMQDMGVAPNAAYRYRIRAWIGVKPSGVSNEVVVFTPK